MYLFPFKANNSLQISLISIFIFRRHKAKKWLLKTGAFLIQVNFNFQYNLNGSNPDGSFTVNDSNSFFSPYKILPIAQENKYLGIFFLFYHGIVRCVYSLESPRRGDSNEYTQHTIIVWKIEKISLNYRYLLPELVP